MSGMNGSRDDDDDLGYLNERIQSISMTTDGRPRYDSRGSGNNGNGITNEEHTLRKRLSSGLLAKSSSSTGSQKSESSSTEYSKESKASFQPYPDILNANDGSKDHLTIKNSDRIWNQVNPKYSVKEIFRNQATPYGGTLGDMIDVTSKKMISMVVTEEKFYHCWHFGRTVLLGDGMFSIDSLILGT